MGDQMDKLAIGMLVIKDNVVQRVQRYFNETQRKELANLLGINAYQQIFMNGRVKYSFSAEEKFGVERTSFTTTFETYRIGGRNKMVLVGEPKFARNNSEKAVDAAAQVKISCATDYKHNKKSAVRNIRDLTNGQVKSIMINVVDYNKKSLKRQMKELDTDRINVEKMFGGSEERYLNGFK
jgi:hypothetical protein